MKVSNFLLPLHANCPVSADCSSRLLADYQLNNAIEADSLNMLRTEEDTKDKPQFLRRGVYEGVLFRIISNIVLRSIDGQCWVEAV